MPDPTHATPDAPDETPDTAEEPQLPLLELADGLPAPVESVAALAEAVADLTAGTGPIAVDAERASGYRWSARAYLVQLRRAGSTTWLVDPIAFETAELAPLQQVMGEAEWVLHAASQDLPCLREIGLEPPSLFDTELAARLLGYPRVGLAALVEALCERRMRKEHSAADWSTRPLPESWLEYAALDVEVLVEIRHRLAAELEEAGKAQWAQEEFAHTLAHRPVPRTDPWRRTSGMHKVRGRRSIAAVRELWEERNAIAQERDVTPGRIIPDASIVAAATAMPADRGSLRALRGFHGRGADRYANRWVAALQRARDLPESDLPPTSLRSDGPPPPRAWSDRDPEAAARLATARPAIAALGEDLSVPVENLMTPDVVRRTLWQPPSAGTEADLDAALAEQLAARDARPWQIALVGPILREAILRPAPPEPEEPTTTE
ncbi:3'-5' exonuclease [Marmoricola endophyticus]|uniref:3'-5' exonuclease n=1 Tax=Marmoricola endophyticus TaxID=2040280 RepID=A0A917F2M3_9ACTN|nr:HRDC domain-containing protein [Marmoricola endophyticus]GGF36907.1 3'-5' exonuclease [Marmoricola endophyticus]